MRNQDTPRAARQKGVDGGVGRGRLVPVDMPLGL
jgi:hypothetical protein